MQEIEHVVANTDDEISLLDLLVVLAENIKLLILGPIVVGALAVGVLQFIPKTYESTSVMNPEIEGDIYNGQFALAVLTSSQLIDAVNLKIGLREGETLTQARKRTLKDITSSVGRQNKLLTLTTKGQTPEQAQALNQMLLLELFARTQPRGAELDRLQRLLQEERAAYEAGLKVQEVLRDRLTQTSGDTDAISRGYAELVQASLERQASIVALEREVQGYTDANVLQPPILPEEHVAPKSALITLLAVLASGFALLVFVFIRSAWRNLDGSAETQGKVQRIRRAFGFGAY